MSAMVTGAPVGGPKTLFWLAIRSNAITGMGFSPDVGGRK
jgi:hypothetical protein